MSDGFETVAISYSQPEAAVMMSFLAWHGIDAYALSEHARTDMGLVTALGGIPVRVHWTLGEEARALLADVTPPTPRTPPPPRRGLWFKVKAVGCFLLGSPPPPPVRAELR